MMHFRASSIWQLMGDPRTGTGLSDTAKTALNSIAKEFVYGFCEVVDSKEMRKGTQVEPDSLALLNMVKFARYEKNTERRKSGLISGECDIYVPAHTRDLKSSWSLATFPATSGEVLAKAKKEGYDWQGRAYMYLWDTPEHWVDYCMVSTPEELRRYEQTELHEVDHIAPHMRVTSALIKRDSALEQKMHDKLGLASEYLKNHVALINIDHK